MGLNLEKLGDFQLARYYLLSSSSSSSFSSSYSYSCYHSFLLLFPLLHLVIILFLAILFHDVGALVREEVERCATRLQILTSGAGDLLLLLVHLLRIHLVILLRVIGVPVRAVVERCATQSCRAMCRTPITWRRIATGRKRRRTTRMVVPGMPGMPECTFLFGMYILVRNVHSCSECTFLFDQLSRDVPHA